MSISLCKANSSRFLEKQKETGAPISHMKSLYRSQKIDGTEIVKAKQSGPNDRVRKPIIPITTHIHYRGDLSGYRTSRLVRSEVTNCH